MPLRHFLQSAPLTAASRICYYYCEQSMCVCCMRVLCMMFSVKEMYRKEIKRSEMKCEVMCCDVLCCVAVRAPISNKCLFWPLRTYFHIFHRYNRSASTIRLDNCEMVLCFFHAIYIHVSDSLISVTHSQRAHTKYVAIAFHFLFCTWHFSMASPLLSSECRKNHVL